MTYSPIAIKRRTVLGDFYERCENIESVPVYLNDVAGEMLGYADESLGRYADAFLFHLPEDFCKRLSMSSYSYGFDFDKTGANKSDHKSRLKLNHILLIVKQRVVGKG